MSRFLDDLEVQTIFFFLLFNIFCALLYVLVFFVIRKCCDKSARESALKLKKRTDSFFQRQEAEQEKIILKDILLKRRTRDLIQNEINYRKYSQMSRGDLGGGLSESFRQAIGFDGEHVPEVKNQDVLLLTEQQDDEDYQNDYLLDGEQPSFKEEDSRFFSEVISDHERACQKEDPKPRHSTLVHEVPKQSELAKAVRLSQRSLFFDIDNANSQRASNSMAGRQRPIQFRGLSVNDVVEEEEYSEEESRNQSQFDESGLLDDSVDESEDVVRARTEQIEKLGSNMLQKVHRKIELDSQVKGWSKGEKNLVSWLRLLRKIDDYKLQKLCGTDIALYIIWLKYAAIFFGVLSVINIFIIPLYITGKPLKVDDFRQNSDQSVLQAITILNVSASSDKVMVVFILAIIVVTSLLLYFSFRYMVKYQVGPDQILKNLKPNRQRTDLSNNDEIVSHNPMDYGMQRYTDLEVADHSIMIENLPRNIPRRELEQRIRSLFERVLGVSQQAKKKVKSSFMLASRVGTQEQPPVVKVSVISNYDKCLTLVKEMKLTAGRLKRSTQLNKENPSERVMIHHKKCCGKTKALDAEDFYERRLRELTSQIKEEEEKQSQRNIGVCFVVFNDGETAKKMLDLKYLGEKIQEKLSPEEAKNIGTDYMIISKAYLQSDIIWENLKKNVTWAVIKRSVLFMTLFILSLVILTPVYAMHLLKPVYNLIYSWLQHNQLLLSYLVAYFQPLVVLFVNFFIIPFLIDLSCEFEDFRRKSSRQISIFRRIFIFMLINTVFVPIASTGTMLYFFQQLRDRRLQDWPTILSENLISYQYLMVKFVIQLTFLSNGFWLIDFFHRMQSWVLKKFHDAKYRDSVVKPEFKDQYVFDLGYHQSYSLVVFLACLLFSLITPIVSFFACLFFFIKFQVDKYNLIFVYFKPYESGGTIRRTVTNYMFFNAFLYLIVLVYFFSLKFNNQYLVAGGILLFTWTTVFFKVRSDLVAEYHLDEDLRVHQGIKSITKVSKNAQDKFKAKWRKAKGRPAQDNNDMLMGSNSDYDSDGDIEVREFEQRCNKIVLFNHRQLQGAYVHPFQRVNPMLYKGDGSEVAS